VLLFHPPIISKLKGNQLGLKTSLRKIIARPRSPTRESRKRANEREREKRKKKTQRIRPFSSHLIARFSLKSHGEATEREEEDR
jgi:hypothetical protein